MIPLAACAHCDLYEVLLGAFGASAVEPAQVKCVAVYFLELVAWAIHHAESFHTRDEATEFGKHLTETRKKVWGEGKPWRGAAHSGMNFLDHVRAMADVFAHAPSAEEALYPNRERQPLA